MNYKMQGFYKKIARKNIKPSADPRNLARLTRMDRKLIRLLDELAPWFTWGNVIKSVS
jgi:hypothetical protein